jgi:ABC-type multidrug transport system ATPase subunit
LRAKVGLLAAESYLYEDLTARENLRFVMTMAGKPTAPARLEAALTEVGLVDESADRVRSFSSGMRRRLSLARLLVLDPELMLLDEPYNNLDAAAVVLVDELVRRWSSEGRAVILATHDAERALALADTVVALQAGTVIYRGSPAGYRMRHAQHVG